MSCRGVVLLTAAAAALACCAILLEPGAQAQTKIQIPDLREPRTYTAKEPEGRCDDCGTVRSIQEIHKRSDPPAYRTNNIQSSSEFDSRAVGAVFVVPFGPGRPEKPYVGGVGTQEMNDRFKDVSYTIIVRMDDGSYRTTERRDGNQYAVGDRVRLAEGRLDLLAPR